MEIENKDNDKIKELEIDNKINFKDNYQQIHILNMNNKVVSKKVSNILKNKNKKLYNVLKREHLI